MPTYTTADLRNVALTGHAGAGKTTLIEALLHAAGAINKPGTVEAGDTVCDFEPEEKAHGHSLNSAFVNFDHEGRHFNLIDTPGYPDFIGQALAALPAVETVAVVIDAEKGIQATTRRVMKTAANRRFPRMIIINRIDAATDRLEELVENIRETFGKECLPLNLPTPDASDVVDLWEKSEGAALFSSCNDAHQAIVEQCVEIDEDLMAQYLEQGGVTKEQLHGAFEKALREAHLIPIVFTSAKTGAGIDDLLHLMANLCPSPLEGNPRPFLLTENEGEEFEWHADPAKTDATFVGHTFKVTADQFVGKVSMVRVHQGSLKAGDSVRIGHDKKATRIAHFSKVMGKSMTEVDTAIAGDIIAIAKVDDLHHDTVVHNSKNEELTNLRFKTMPTPKPMYGIAIEAKNRGDEVKIGAALAKLQEEDPTFAVERIAATHQTVARGLGDLHMRVLLEKLHNRFKLDLNTAPPKVAYKETIAGNAKAQHRHKKQTGGAGQFGEVHLTVEPAHPSDDGTIPDFEFVDATFGGSVPKQFMPAIEKGVRRAMQEGAVAGYPMTGIRVSVTDGKYHPVDSKEIAFMSAGRRAFIDAVREAKPVLLEPFVDLEVTAPVSAVGDITADLSAKRAHIGETDYIAGDMVMVHAKVPLSEMNLYSSQLKSMTAGQGTYVMDYSHDERTPPNVQQEIIAQYAPTDDDD